MRAVEYTVTASENDISTPGIDHNQRNTGSSGKIASEAHEDQ